MSTFPNLSVPLVLASQSPRRRRLLEQVDVSFQVQVSPADEHLEDALPPFQTARRLANRKATPVADQHPEALVLAADTIVAHEDDILGKPASAAEARRTLRRLSDDAHAVYTGLALRHAASNRTVVTGEKTRVQFAALSDAEIDVYVDTGSPMDKAGAYGIQDHTGPLFVRRLEGDYYNVVGLPLRRLYDALRSDFGDLIDL